MLSIGRPSPASIRAYLAAQAKLDFTYAAVGSSALQPPLGHEQPPPGFVLDHLRLEVGQGEHAFSAAAAALKGWGQFRLGWLEASPPGTPIEPGEVISVLVHALGCCWLNACRIVYTVDTAGPVRRFGFGYGTLPSHAESGEERFLVEWNAADNSVTYDILAFSRPRHLLTRVFYPVVRRLQRKFARDSAAAMLRAIETAAELKLRAGTQPSLLGLRDKNR